MMSAALTLTRLLVQVLAAAIPRDCRRQWREEWLAELAYAAARFQPRQRGWWRLTRMGFGALPDALRFRLHPRPRPYRQTPLRPLSGFTSDLRHAARTLRGSPAFAAGVVASVSLGIAVNTAAFGLLDSLMLAPFPGVQDQHRLAAISLETPCGGSRCALATSPDREFPALRDALPSIESLAASAWAQVAVRARGEAASVPASLVSANYFDVLGTRLALGRAPLATETHVAVISHAFWRSVLNGDPRVLGDSIQVAGVPVQVVGVASAKFGGVERAGLASGRDSGTGLWLPLALAEAVMPASNDTTAGTLRRYSLRFVGRLTRTATHEQLDAEAGAAGPRVAAAHGDVPSVRVVAGRVWRRRPTAVSVGTIMALPLLVLAIACVNASSLLLARGTQQGREIRVRLALGASRWRVMRQALAESLVLAMLSAGVALALTRLTMDLVRTRFDAAVAIDLRVLAFTIVIACGSAVAFGLVPAVRAISRTQLPLAPAGRATTDRVGTGGRRLLVVMQVAASLALLTGGAHLLAHVHGALAETGTDQPERILMASFDLRSLRLPASAQHDFYRRLQEEVARLPDVERYGLARKTAFWTFGRGKGESAVVASTDTEPRDGQVFVGGYAGGDIFAALGLRVVEGRTFSPEDRTGPPRVAVVNQALASSLFQGRALGRTLRVAPHRAGTTPREPAVVQIVGVTESAVERSYSDRLMPAVYLPVPLVDEPALTLYVRSRGNQDGLAAAIRRVASDINLRVPVEVETLASLRDARNRGDRLAAAAISTLGGVALALAAAGLYGMVSFVVTLRRRELGVRAALGAEPMTLLRMVLSQGMRMALLGIAIGASIGVAASVTMHASMRGMPAPDPLLFAGGGAVLLATMLLASLAPAFRASRVNPVEVLGAD